MNRPNVPEKECAQPVYEYIVAMPTYIYETTDPAKPVRAFELSKASTTSGFAATRKLAKERGV